MSICPKCKGKKISTAKVCQACYLNKPELKRELKGKGKYKVGFTFCGVERKVRL